MHHKNIPSLASFISIILLTLNTLIHSSSSSSSTSPSPSPRVEEHYANCAPQNLTCGLSQNITYPFWDSSNKPSYCGHPKFKVECQSNFPTIQIQNETYKILNISYDSHAFTVSKQQFSQGPCPTTQEQLTNTTLDLTLFNLTSRSENATVFYNCSKIVNSNALFSFTCPPNEYDENVLTSTNSFLTVDEEWEDKLRKICPVEIYLPVLRDEVISLNNNGSDDVTRAVRKGFELSWLIDQSQCKECMGSGGRCGYNETLDQPVCFCSGGIYSRNCSVTKALSPGQSNKKITLWLAISAAAIGISIILAVGIWCFYRHRKSSEHLELPTSNTFSTTLDANASTYFGVKIFSYTELEEATDYFNPGKELGKGGYGTVYHGTLHDGREVAIKRLYENSNKRAEQFLNEVEILANLRHKNLVNLYGCTSRQSRELLLVYEYVPNGTVADHLHGRKADLRLLPWPTRLRIATETAGALVYLHASDITHRDVKTQNILLDKDLAVKVADFGLSRLFPINVSHVSTAPQGTPGYVDPEYYQCYQLTQKSDVYSFGVVLAELLSSKAAVDVTRRRAEINLSNMLIAKMQSDALGDFVDPLLGFESNSTRKEITAVAGLAFQCLQNTREMRPSMAQVLERLYNIRDKIDEINRPEVLVIPSDDVSMLKGDFSPTSPPREDNTLKRLMPHASV